MYRILIKNREQNQTENFKYSFYTVDDIVFQTCDLNVATSTFRELMEKYLVTDITIVKVIETNITIDSPELKTVTILPGFITLLNDGTNFAILFDLTADTTSTSNNITTVEKVTQNVCKALGRSLCGCSMCGIPATYSTSSSSSTTTKTDYDNYTCIDINDDIAKSVKEYLEGLGLTNVTVSPTTGITATNSTGNPVEGTLEVEKGLFQYYSRETQTNDYVSSAFSVVLKSTVEEKDTASDTTSTDTDTDEANDTSTNEDTTTTQE